MSWHSVPVGSEPDQSGPDGDTRDAGGFEPGDAIDAAAADLRIDLEIEARRRERWIRRRLSDEATLSGALAAAKGAEVAVQLITGDRVPGRLVSVGSDVIELRRRHGSTWVVIEAVTALEVGEPVPASGPALDGKSMVEVLCDLVGERTEVLLTLAGGTAVRGEVLAVGPVATIHTGPGGHTTYVPVAAVVSVTLPG